MNEVVKKINVVQLERNFFWGLLITLIFSVILYSFFVNQIVLNIVERENLENDIVALSSKISGFEFNYIALKNDIDIDYAHSIGFVDVKNVKFASRRLPTTALSINIDR